jgi:hypothetical protein
MIKIIKIENAKGEIFDAIQVGDIYKKDMSAHYGNKKGEIIMEFVKVKRFIKTRNDFSANATEYTAQQIVD